MTLLEVGGKWILGFDPKLKKISAHNKEIIDAIHWKYKYTVETGVACDICGEELKMERMKMITLTFPEVTIKCSGCNHPWSYFL